MLKQVFLGVSAMKITTTPLDGLVVVETTPFVDQRGQFSRLFCADELGSVLESRTIKQINHSITLQVGTVRGMHMQLPPHAELKIIKCMQGAVLDVAVDCRRSSSTFLQWHAVELTSANNQMMVIPEGFAHGFQVLSPKSELLYLHTEFYTPSAEFGLHPSDPTIGVRWPLPISTISNRDAYLPNVDDKLIGCCP
jgi:dTDP-4-dehydrorhamnose 3,5-epimerase